MFESHMLLDGVHQIFKEDFMKKSVKKFSIVVALLAVVFAFTSCKQLWDSVLEVSALFDTTYVATVGDDTVKFTFTNEMNGPYELIVKVNGQPVEDMFWNLDASSDEECKPILIYQDGTTSSRIIGTLIPNSRTPRKLKANAAFDKKIGFVQIPVNTEFEKQ